MTPYWDHIASVVAYVMIQALADRSRPCSSMIHLPLCNPQSQHPVVPVSFSKDFSFKERRRGVIDLKENCGLYLRAVFERAVCICHAKRYVFVSGVRALFFSRSRLLVLVVGS